MELNAAASLRCFLKEACRKDFNLRLRRSFLGEREVKEASTWIVASRLLRTTLLLNAAGDTCVIDSIYVLFRFIVDFGVPVTCKICDLGVLPLPCMRVHVHVTCTVNLCCTTTANRPIRFVCYQFITVYAYYCL